MKRFLAPKWLGAHRVAGKALYRALLVQCPQLPIPPESREGVTKFIKHSFRRNRHLQSRRLLAVAFKAGYEAEALLRSSASGSEENTRRVLALLSSLQDRPLPPRATTKPDHVPHLRPQPRLPAPYPGAIPVLDRPYARISGRRRVPILITANKQPMLRFKRPQSPFLSRVIRNKIDRSDRHYRNMKELIEVRLPEAEDEDNWEKILGVRDERGGFGHAMQDVIRIRQGVEAAHVEKRNAMAQKMMEIVERERELAEREKIERKVQKNLVKRAKTAERKANLARTEEAPRGVSCDEGE